MLLMRNVATVNLFWFDNLRMFIVVIFWRYLTLYSWKIYVYYELIWIMKMHALIQRDRVVKIFAILILPRSQSQKMK